MTLKQWNELKPGDFVMYSGKGHKQGVVCVLTGDDAGIGSVGVKGMVVLGRDAVWDKEVPWRRVFRDGSYRNWKKVNCVMIH